MHRARRVILLLCVLPVIVAPHGAAAQVYPPVPYARLFPARDSAASCETVVLREGEDTWLDAAAPEETYGADTRLSADGNPANTALIRWDLSSIPSTHRVTGAAILVNHLDPLDESETLYQIYALKRPWSEADANWQTAHVSAPWGKPGAADPIADRQNTPMGRTPLTEKSPAEVRIELNEQGMAQVQRWVDGSETNYGLVLQDYESGDGFRFGSFESDSPPRLEVMHCSAGEVWGSFSGGRGVWSLGQVAPPLVTPERVIAFQDGVAPNADYAGTADTYIDQDAPDVSYGRDAAARVAGDSPSGTQNDVSALLRWDVRAVPRGSQVISATIALRAVNTSADAYEIYEVQRAWAEESATWLAAGPANSWLYGGAFGRSDREGESLGQYRPDKPGITVIGLSKRALAVIQRWIDDPASNKGLLIAAPKAADSADFDTREAATATNRPRLTIWYLN